MGGHGGLNILPQKSWHVYNQDNREKVARDEAKYEEQQKELRHKHAQAEREYRRSLLLSRAREARGVTAPDTAALPEAAAHTAATLSAPVSAPSSVPQQQLAQQPSSAQQPVSVPQQRHVQQPQQRDVVVEAAKASTSAAAKQPTHQPRHQQQRHQQQQQQLSARQEAFQEGTMQFAQQQQSGMFGKADGNSGGLLKHINFFSEQEARLKHPEVQAEQRKERMARGKEETQTSDARFDEKFQLGHGMAGKDARPWYTRPTGPSTEGEKGPDGLQQPAWGVPVQVQLVALAGPSVISSALPAVHAPLLTAHAHRKEERRKDRKEKKHKKDKHKKDRRKDEEAVEKQQQLQRLREERTAREQAERQRQQSLLASHATDVLSADHANKPGAYHGAYGFAKRKR